MDLLLEHFAYTKPNFNPNHQSELLGGKFKILFLTARHQLCAWQYYLSCTKGDQQDQDESVTRTVKLAQTALE